MTKPLPPHLKKKRRRIGGRQKNTPNKRTTEIIEQARIDVENAIVTSGHRGEPTRQLKKLAKDMLEDYMMAFHNQAVVYQPLPDGVSIPGREPNPEKFKEWGTLVVKTAQALAEFQSPKFRAIVVSGTPGEGTGSPPALPVSPLGSNVVTLDDPVALGRVYQRMVKSIR